MKTKTTTNNKTFKKVKEISIFRMQKEKTFRKQREKWGWDDRETWNLDQRIALFTLPRLKRFQALRNGHPASLTEKQWDKILKKIIYSMEVIASDRLYEKRTDAKRVQEGFELFGKYFLSLWW